MKYTGIIWDKGCAIMIDPFYRSFHNSIAWGASSDGGSSSGGSAGDPTPLAPLVFRSAPGPQDDEDEPGNAGSQSGEPTISRNGNEIEVQLAASATVLTVDDLFQNPQNPTVVMSVAQYIDDYRAELEAEYRAEDANVQIFLGGSYGDGMNAPENPTVEQIKYYRRHHEHFDDFLFKETDMWPGHRAEHDAREAISEDHLQHRLVVEQGYSIAEAVMIRNGYDLDGHVIINAAAQTAEYASINSGDVLVSDGVDISEGIMMIDPKLEGMPEVAIPVYEGMDGFHDSDRFFHEYILSLEAPDHINGQDGLLAIQQALIANPTPYEFDIATADGQLNNAGPSPLNDANLVRSYVVKNPNPNQTDIIINYTVDGAHVLEEGYVLRYGELNDDGGITLHTYGEGDSVIQATGNLIKGDDEFVLQPSNPVSVVVEAFRELGDLLLEEFEEQIENTTDQLWLENGSEIFQEASQILEDF
ncbi:hypothetical protein [Pontivivens ytuae]|uniref:Uncharacterized protein n=1 Tax=Pontivivens ytuae TaxID=2789856 RepID=A0A7S9LUK0_9RHOB|nr:hypothetical protein [Pontivivens ytuae]QPH55591.1 hypothetical protein I0K15_07620 [Pontivivens ytuae]